MDNPITIFVCGECGSHNIDTTVEKVDFGQKWDFYAPVRHCQKCKFNWTDHVAEELYEKMAQSKPEPSVPKETYDQLHIDFVNRGVEIERLTAENKAKDEAHKNEIFKLNDICVERCRAKDEKARLFRIEVQEALEALIGCEDEKATEIIEQALKDKDNG